MTKTIEKTRRWCALLAIGCIALACTNKPSDAQSRPKALSAYNGLGTNSLTTNSLAANGLWLNGLWLNGLWLNGLWLNGLWLNGLWLNGLWLNGLWLNGTWSDALTADLRAPGDALRQNSHLRQVLQYIYSCAMPPSTYDKELDPNDGALRCSSEGMCDSGYECSSAGTCVVPLRGAIGVGINADGTSWGSAGHCDETCQRWVSACVLARTNAYGVKVQISMRAPVDAPQAIKDALAVSDVERNGDATTPAFSLREGAYYGNLFATTPTTSPPIGGNGPATGPIASTPAFYACAGPGSNIPQITNRFCSSQGDQTVINVPGVCLGTSTQGAVCAGEDTNPTSPTFGAIQDCHTQSNLGGAAYKEVITVYLKQPIAVCGNSTCESTEDAQGCPTDCHPGTWASDFVANITGSLGGGSLQAEAFGPTAAGPDNSIVVSGTLADDLDLGGGILPVSQGRGFLAKFNPDGTYAWGVRFGGADIQSIGDWALRISPNGNVTVGGLLSQAISGVDRRGISITRFSADGVALQSSSVPLGDVPTFNMHPNYLYLGLDSQSNVIVEAAYRGTVVIGSSSFSNSDYAGTYLAKVSPAGSVLWAKSFDAVPGGLTVDPAGNVLVLTTSGVSVPSVGNGTVRKLAPDGSLLWTKAAGSAVRFADANADSAGNFYVTGKLSPGQDFGEGAITDATDDSPFLAKYGSDGAVLWVSRPRILCPWGASSCPASTFESYGLAGVLVVFDPAGTPVLATFGNSMIGGTVDYGFGAFPVFAGAQTFLSAYSPSDGAVQWAKALPTPVYAFPLGLAIDSRGHVVVSGLYVGSMVADDHLLVTQTPEDDNLMNGFLASFAMPSLTDKSPPVIGGGTDSAGSPVLSVPRPIFVQATSQQGAQVFFVPPTATDAANAGVSVACVPAPNSTFPIGQTTVTCTASDPVGNHASASFLVTVVDKLGPAFPPGSDIVTNATSSGGAVVTYETPAATDQVSGPASVTCTGSASGSLFPVGRTPIACTATDAAGNVGRVEFAVEVKATGAPLGAACTAAAGCGSGFCVDGVCCNSACGGGNANDCQACSVAAGGATNGSCTAVSAARVCRTATGVCDVPEYCNGTSLACPANAFAAAGTVCAPTSNTCESPGVCSGTGASCSAPAPIPGCGPPRFTSVPGPVAAYATGTNGAKVTYTVPKAVDPAGRSVPVSCLPASGAQFPLKTTTVNCTASNASGVVKTSFTVMVTYQAPTDATFFVTPRPNTLFRIGRPVPVRFKLTGASANITNLVAKLTVTKISNTVQGTTEVTSDETVDDTDFVFKYRSLLKWYAYRWKTRDQTQGTYRLTADLGDGVVHQIDVSLAAPR